MLNFIAVLIFAFAVFSLVSVKCGFYKTEYDSRNARHNALMVLGAVLLGCFSLVIFYLLKENSLMYPFAKPLINCNPYEQMFDALMKKQLYLDIEPEEALLRMANPYDTELRNSLGVSYLWDRAFYNGHYYSYFGIAPLILIYFPFYFITGKVPAPQTVCLIISLVFIPLCTALTVRVGRVFAKKVNLYILFFSVFACTSGSLIFMVQSSADFYYIAVASGLLFLAAFLYFTVCAHEKDEYKKKALYFFLSGISLVLLTASRPNLAIYFVTAVPVYLSVLFGKEFKISEKAVQVLSFAVPVTAGAAAIMYYNYARFGSVFEFGATYQLTVHDVGDYSFSPALIMPALYFYFFKMPRFTSEAPFLELPFIRPDTGSKYLYVTSTVGAFAFLQNWVCVFSPAVLTGQKDRVKKGFIALSLICTLILAYYDICFAGINLRYLADISLVLILVSSVLLEDIYTNIKKEQTKKPAYIIILFLMLLSFIFGLMLVLNNERDYLFKKYLK
ncbi:MAG: hypothetical protein E7514_03955 [Ruminococcaceae bacterium]|nr:hypothetical protein [Oscillospiraceae bacterium]